jgi:small-conductance mechanosensitive channel
MDIEKAYRLISEKLSLWLRELVRLLPNILLAALVLTIGIVLSKLARNLTRKFFMRLGHATTLTSLFASFIHLVCIGITLFATLSILQLDKAVTSILAGAGIAGLALAFAFQDIASNFISGIFLSFRKPLRVGDVVKVKDYMGKVKEINLRDTVIRTFQGQLVIIPNKEIFQNPIENFSLLGKRRGSYRWGVVR